jgi:hypothetical protein
MNLSVSPSLSDAGLCLTINGNSIGETFKDSNNKMKQLKVVLGNNDKNPFKPMKISGSGNNHHKEMWLNVRDVTGVKDGKGVMSVTINDWKDYVSVR